MGGTSKPDQLQCGSRTRKPWCLLGQAKKLYQGRGYMLRMSDAVIKVRNIEMFLIWNPGFSIVTFKNQQILLPKTQFVSCPTQATPTGLNYHKLKPKCLFACFEGLITHLHPSLSSRKWLISWRFLNLSCSFTLCVCIHYIYHCIWPSHPLWQPNPLPSLDSQKPSGLVGPL